MTGGSRRPWWLLVVLLIVLGVLLIVSSRTMLLKTRSLFTVSVNCSTGRSSDLIPCWSNFVPSLRSCFTSVTPAS